MTKWGSLVFEPTESLLSWNPPTWGGIYAIIIKKDPVNKPDDETVLYFDESGNFAIHGINHTHHKYNCWKHHAHKRDLYVSVARIFTDGLRKKAMQQLIDKYKPMCNK